MMGQGPQNFFKCQRNSLKSSGSCHFILNISNRFSSWKSWDYPALRTLLSKLNYKKALFLMEKVSPWPSKSNIPGFAFLPLSYNAHLQNYINSKENTLLADALSCTNGSLHKSFRERPDWNWSHRNFPLETAVVSSFVRSLSYWWHLYCICELHSSSTMWVVIVLHLIPLPHNRLLKTTNKNS